MKDSHKLLHPKETLSLSLTFSPPVATRETLDVWIWLSCCSACFREEDGEEDEEVVGKRREPMGPESVLRV